MSTQIRTDDIQPCLQRTTLRRQAPGAGVQTVALVGNPNTGKTTLFNALTGLSQRVGNYPGVTVERKVGRLKLRGGLEVDLLDLPGAYSLAAHSPDEMIVADVLMGQVEGEAPVSVVLAIVDASNLQRNLYLVSQVLELGLPVVIALNMVDVAASRRVRIDAAMLSQRIGVPVVPTCANRHRGLDDLRRAIADVVSGERSAEPAGLPRFPESLGRQVRTLAQDVELSWDGRVRKLSEVEAFRALVDEGGYAEQRLVEAQGPAFGRRLLEVRSKVHTKAPLSALETEARYAWISQVISGCLVRPERLQTILSDRLDRVLTHRVLGTLIFVGMMGLVFQSIFTWAGPLMDWIDGLFGGLGAWVGATMPGGALKSLVVDGVIGGVGSVVIFLPQIAILFFFIAILEDGGYMARAAFLMDRLLTRCGLSGKSFIPMLSSFACAVPGIMATRTIEDRRDRFTTILVAPLMSCSARLPVYTIFIAAFIPDHMLLGGWVGLQGLTLFGMYCVGIGVAVPVAWVLKKTLLKGASSPFVLELPSYKLPDPKTVGMRVYQSSKAFLSRAGRIILAAAIVMWALAYFPRPAGIVENYEARQEEILSTHAGQAQAEALAAIDAGMSSELLKQSFLGRAGHFIEPVVRPLGWDWRIGMAAVASFPAREIVVASLGTIYSLGSGVDETSEGLRHALQAATWDDGRPIFTVPVALSVMVFFALCAQCAATLAVIQRETRSWGWAGFAFGYMTLLAYIGAWVTYQATTALGWGG